LISLPDFGYMLIAENLQNSTEAVCAGSNEMYGERKQGRGTPETPYFKSFTAMGCRVSFL